MADNGGAPSTELSDKKRHMNIKNAVDAEQYLESNALRQTLQWLTHEIILHKPDTPLLFLRDLMTAKINQTEIAPTNGGTSTSRALTASSSLRKETLAVLVENADIAVSKCVQYAADCKDTSDRRRASALLKGLETRVNQLSEQLLPAEERKVNVASRQRPTPIQVPQSANLNPPGRNAPNSAARSLALRGLKKVTPTIGEVEESEDTESEESPQTAHTPVEWKVSNQWDRSPSKEKETRDASNTGSSLPTTDVDKGGDENSKIKAIIKRKHASLGKWTAEDRCRAAFAKIDSDHDGSLNKKEFRSALQQVGVQMTPRAVDNLLQRIDSNKDGEISLEEFVNFYKRVMEDGGDEEIDITEMAPMCGCLPASGRQSYFRQRTSSVSDDGMAENESHKYAALVRCVLHAREGLNRRKQLASSSRQVSTDPEMINYLKGNPLIEGKTHQGMSVALLESRQEGSDPDANAKIIQRARKNWKIIPDDSWYLAWTMFTMVLIIFYMGVVPVRLSFSASALDNAFVQGQDGWYWVDFVSDGVFLLDIAMNFLVIIKTNSGEYIINLLDIALFQIHSKWFYIDLLASFPTSILNYPPPDNWKPSDDDNAQLEPEEGDNSPVNFGEFSGVNKMLRMVRIVKLARVFRMLRFMKDFEDLAIVNPASLRLVKLLVVFIIVLHFVSCAFWALNAYEGFCEDDDSVHGDCAANIAWYIQKDAAKEAHLTTQYTWAFYWAISAMTGVGYDIEPRTYLQHVFTTFIIISGMFMNAVIIGSVPGAIENLDRVQSERKRDLDNINDYLRKQQVPTHLIRSVRSFYEYLHGCDYDLRMGEDKLLGGLPESLRTRVKVATAVRAIERIPLFSDLHASCKIQIIQRLQPKIVVPGERLAVQDDIGDAMYIIKTGRVQLKRTPKPKRNATKWQLAKRKLSERNGGHLSNTAENVVKAISKVAELTSGDFFGENCLLGRKNDTSAVAVDYSDLLELTVEDCKELCEEYQELKDQITMTAKTRYLAHVPHEERNNDDIQDLEHSILGRPSPSNVSSLGSGAPGSGRLSTRRMTKLLMDEFADISLGSGGACSARTTAPARLKP